MLAAWIGFALTEYLDLALAAALRVFGFIGVELLALVWICIQDVDSAKFLFRLGSNG